MIQYFSEKLNEFKFKFEGLEQIKENYSQCFQDMFVLSMLDGKKNGFFVEIGAFHPYELSNTFLLEKNYNWSGISIDVNKQIEKLFEGRNLNFVLQDALTIDYKQLLNSYSAPNQIDYLQIDIEPTTQTFECLKKIPFEEYRFSVITYETDWYNSSVSKEERDFIRKTSREIFEKNGYKLVIEDVEDGPGFPFEDWYVDPNIVSEDKINLILQNKINSNPGDFFFDK
jgi:hypothetical protein